MVLARRLTSDTCTYPQSDPRKAIQQHGVNVRAVSRHVQCIQIPCLSLTPKSSETIARLESKFTGSKVLSHLPRWDETIPQISLRSNTGQIGSSAKALSNGYPLPQLYCLWSSPPSKLYASPPLCLPLIPRRRTKHSGFYISAAALLPSAPIFNTI